MIKRSVSAASSMSAARRAASRLAVRPLLRRSASTAATDAQVLPKSARVVVVGGGIIGNSVAYHLALRGWTDVLLIERHALTAGTTWHAAGLMVTFGSLSETSTEWRKYAKSLYATTLEAETGQSTGFKGCGFIELASSKDRQLEYRRIAAFNRSKGVDVQEIGPDEIKQLFPLCRTEDVLSGFYVKDDGRVNPVDASTALARGFKQRGGLVREGYELQEVLHEKGRVTGVRVKGAEEATIDCEYVVNATGMWARQVGAESGVLVPNQAAEHYYLITEPMADVDPNWPVVEDPANFTYIRPEAGGLMVGLFEGEGQAWKVQNVPDDFSFGEIEPDWDRMAPYLEAAMSRVPASLDAGVRKFFCGPESFTPDSAPIVGESPEIAGYFIAAGLNSIGILTGPGLGRTVANWIVDGRSDEDVTGVRASRTRAFEATPRHRRERTAEALANTYKCHYPNKLTETARDAMRSPIHSRLVDKKGAFRAVSGWECPDFFKASHLPLTWGKPSYSDAWRAEHLAVREQVGLIDMSFMSKFAFAGPDAGKILQRLSTANIDPASSKVTYTQWLDAANGRIKADLTITRLPQSWGRETGLVPSFGAFCDDHAAFMIVATDTAHREVESILRRAILPGEIACLSDATGGLAMFSVQGPQSRALLLAALDDENDKEALQSMPFRGAAHLAVGLCPSVLVQRITYVGELGFEVYVPSEFALNVYDHLSSVGESMGLRNVGLAALGSLRLEKGYRDFGHDVDNCDTPHDAGLAFTCDFNKDFNGREAVLADKKRPRQRRLVSLLCDDDAAFLHHGDLVFRDGELVGDVRSASYGHSLKGPVALAMVAAAEGLVVNREWLTTADFAVQVNGDRHLKATASLGSLYDPKGTKIKQ